MKNPEDVGQASSLTPDDSQAKSLIYDPIADKSLVPNASQAKSLTYGEIEARSVTHVADTIAVQTGESVVETRRLFDQLTESQAADVHLALASGPFIALTRLRELTAALDKKAFVE